MAPKTDDCVMCGEKCPPDCLVRCSNCRAGLHWSCRVNNPRVKKAPEFLVKSPETCSWLRILCDPCNAKPASNVAAGLEDKVDALADKVEGLVAAFSATGPRSYADVVKDAAKQGAVQGAVEAAEEEARRRSIVIDHLPVKEDIPDNAQVAELLDYLGVAQSTKVIKVHRMGRGVPEKKIPPKVKVELESATMQRQLLSKDLRPLLRRDDCPTPDLYLNPSRSHEERLLHRQLRARRNELNKDVPNLDSAYFVDYRKNRLVKKEGGRPDWDGPADVGWPDFLARWKPARPAPPAARPRANTASRPAPATQGN